MRAIATKLYIEHQNKSPLLLPTALNMTRKLKMGAGMTYRCFKRFAPTSINFENLVKFLFKGKNSVDVFYDSKESAEYTIISENFIVNILSMESNAHINDKQAKAISQIMQRLLFHPEARAKSLAVDFDMSKDEIKHAYKLIAGSNTLSYILSEINAKPAIIRELVYLLEHRDFLDKYLSHNHIYPIILELHLGVWCPHSCIFCYTKHDISRNYKYKKEGRNVLTPEQVTALIDEFAMHGTKEVWLSGGLEPLAGRKDTFLAAVEAARRNGLTMRLYTSGDMFDEDTRRAALKCDWVRFDICGHNKALSEAVQRPVSLRYNYENQIVNMLKLIELKKEEGSSVKIGICYLIVPDPPNYNYISEAIDMAYSLGADFFDLRVDMADLVPSFDASQINEIIGQSLMVLGKKQMGFYNGMRIDLRGIRRHELESHKVLPNMQ